KMHFQSPLELTSIITNAMLKINSGRENLIAYENNQAIKHNLAFRSLFNDSILDFDIEKHFQSKISFDLERAVTTRFVIGAFSILLLLLLFLNAMNLITNNSLSDISMQKENQKQLAIQVKVTSEKNEQLKTDIKSLSKIKYKGESVSGLLKIVSLASIDKLQLNDLKIKRNNSDKYEVKLSGESSSKDEVISLIKNLESNTELSSIELIWMDKKKDGSYQVKKSLFDFQFSINMIYNENKNS
ncbi:MAG: PilN domain-containing protein, partial [Ignavibacteria bacterium]|nr:PilN domain-containing protein [Ignavibacteria bacterium]